MSKSILTAAQIGCGKFAHQQDLVNLSTHEKVNLKWVCDIDLKAAKSAAKPLHTQHQLPDTESCCACSTSDTCGV